MKKELIIICILFIMSRTILEIIKYNHLEKYNCKDPKYIKIKKRYEKIMTFFWGVGLITLYNIVDVKYSFIGIIIIFLGSISLLSLYFYLEDYIFYKKVGC